MNMSINEMASLLENAYCQEGYKKVFHLNNDEIIAIADNGDDDITVQVCTEDGNTKLILFKLPVVIDEPINWETIADIVNDYITGNDLFIDHVYEWENDTDDTGSALKTYFNSNNPLTESVSTNKFNSLYNEIINDLKK